MSQTKELSAPAAWVDRLAAHEAERIYEMMPSMFGERGQAIVRLKAGIVDVLNSEIARRAA
jgi:hypothetical protein